MTPVLLDTHAYVWAVTAPQRLSEAARATVADRSTRVQVSAATAWEMAIKFHRGKWPEAEPLLADHHRILARLTATPLPISAEHAIRSGSLRWDHSDPFDRMLAAQALMTGSRLVTRDAAFAELAGLDLLW